MSSTEGLPLLITARDLVGMVGKSKHWVYARLRKRGIAYRREIQTAEVAAKWPELYASLALRYAGKRPPCPCCGEPVLISCSSCDFAQ